jgi:hypothetical protein
MAGTMQKPQPWSQPREKNVASGLCLVTASG